MYLLTKPGDERIDDFVKAQSRLDLSYPSIGATRNGNHPSGFVVDHNRIYLGSGQAAFDAARRALCQWQHFRFGWIELHGADVDPAPDQTVAVLARALGLWVLNACRVVYVVEEERPVRRFSFAYGTLPDHAESGEERFQVEWRKEDDSVWYDILAFSRPNQLLSQIAYPYVRYKQRQFSRASLRLDSHGETAPGQGTCGVGQLLANREFDLRSLSMNDANLTELKVVVERTVQPVRATMARKRRMREELLAHLVAILAVRHFLLALLRMIEPL